MSARRVAPVRGWGPAGQRAALSITFDNFGEAAEIEMGWWGDRPIGSHPTAAYLPTLIDALGEIPATYFVEASNAAIYPDQLRSWVAAGHEIGVHAWRHEFWSRCEAPARRDILARSVAAFARLGIDAVGFRPPGGTVPDAAWQEFRDAGIRYCSPLDEPGPAVIGDVISLPFRWNDVDVFVIDERLARVREAAGSPSAPASLADWRTGVLHSLDEAVAQGGHRVVIFHPESLLQDQARLAVLRDLVAHARRQDVWIATAGDVAAFLTWDGALREKRPEPAAINQGE